MSPRSNRPRRRSGARPAQGTPLPPRLDAYPRRERVRGRDFIVRPVRGEAGRAYRCPGCDQIISPQTPHVVVWPDDLILGEGLEECRHWHTGCWRHPGP